MGEGQSEGIGNALQPIDSRCLDSRWHGSSAVRGNLAAHDGKKVQNAHIFDSYPGHGLQAVDVLVDQGFAIEGEQGG